MSYSSLLLFVLLFVGCCAVGVVPSVIWYVIAEYRSKCRAVRRWDAICEMHEMQREISACMRELQRSQWKTY